MGYNYEGIGTTAAPHQIPKTYNHDFIRVQIGRGQKDFDCAKQAITSWRMFPDGWTEIAPAPTPIEAGTVVAMFAKFGGLWWRNSCRIVYVVDEAKKFGFAYGTLPDHIARGEELFLVEMDENDMVWYQLRAFSRPRYWLAVVGYPVLRLLQAIFRRQSAQQMTFHIQSIHTV